MQPLLCFAIVALTQAADPWSQFMRSNRHDSVANMSITGSTKPNIAWTFKTGDMVTGSPLLTANAVIIGSNDGKLYSIDRSSGAQNWAYDTGAAVSASGSPTLSDDGQFVYVGSASGAILKIAVDSGTLGDSYMTGDLINSAPAVGPDGQVYIGSGDGNLWAFTKDLGFLWRFKTSNIVQGSASISDDGSTVFFGGVDMNIYSLNAKDGSLNWNVSTTGRIKGSPAVGNGLIFIGNYEDKTMFALKQSDGSKVWTFVAGDFIYSAPALSSDGRTLYFTSTDSYAYALDAATGNQLWKFGTQGYVDSSIAIVGDGTVVFGSADGAVRGLDASKGTAVWSVNTTATIESSPAVDSSGSVYIGCFNGNVYKIGA
eukprot:m.16630 g.16630  ORF g.16630 m.16630 type:complete len:371 (+) comp10594_c0_seq1:81-1193(+)